MDCPTVTAGALSDGLASRPDGSQAAQHCCHTVALVMAPGYDYHWYRLDNNGMWSHKPGGWLATNRDASGNLISDPRTCNRGPYTTFCGCYCVCKSQVRIR